MVKLIMQVCRVCQIEFDPNSAAKKIAGGLVDECPEHATDLVGKVLGEMIWSHKTAPALELRNPNGSVKRKAELGQTRRGDVPSSKKQTTQLPGFIRSPKKEEAPRPMAVWFNEQSRTLFMVDASNRLFAAELPQGLSWHQIEQSRSRSCLIQSKDCVARAMKMLQKLL